MTTRARKWPTQVVGQLMEIFYRSLLTYVTRYLLALRNKRTGTVSLLPTAKSPYVMTRTVKALKSTPSSAALPKVQYLQAKTTLGQTFGTKRQKADIRMQERNQVDPDAMQGVMDYVIETIDKGVENLPTAGLVYPASMMESFADHEPKRRVRKLPTKAVLSLHSPPQQAIPKMCILFTTSFPRQNGKSSISQVSTVVAWHCFPTRDLTGLMNIWSH